MLFKKATCFSAGSPLMHRSSWLHSSTNSSGTWVLRFVCKTFGGCYNVLQGTNNLERSIVSIVSGEKMNSGAIVYIVSRQPCYIHERYLPPSPHRLETSPPSSRWILSSWILSPSNHRAPQAYQSTPNPAPPMCATWSNIFQPLTSPTKSTATCQKKMSMLKENKGKTR
jgi:hypothetical protein